MVEKCQDPVTVELTLERNGQTVFQQVFDSTDVVEDKFQLWVEMNRNDTHLELWVKDMDAVTLFLFYTTSSSFSHYSYTPSQINTSCIS